METNQVNPTPTTNPEASDKPQEINPLAEQFSRIAKQEKFVAEERKKIEEAKKAFEQDKQEVERYRSLKTKDPFEILEHFGVSYEKLVEADKNRRITPMDPAARKALETVEQLRMELQTKEETAQRERLSRAEVKLMADIDSEIKANEYDLIERLGEQNAVYDYMNELYQQTGQIPDVKEACEAITNHLVEQYSRIKDSKWLKPKEEVKVEEPILETKAKSLSNKMTQSTIGSTKPMTEADRLRAAVTAMNAIKK